MCRRVARIWKRGGYFERVRKVQTTLTRILIVLESVSHGLSENSDQKQVVSKKKKKKKKKRSSPKLSLIFRPNSEIQRFFPPKNRWSPKKKKKVFAEIESDFSAKFGNTNVSGGAIFNFSQQIGLKSIKNVRF